MLERAEPQSPGGRRRPVGRPHDHPEHGEGALSGEQPAARQPLGEGKDDGRRHDRGGGEDEHGGEKRGPALDAQCARDRDGPEAEQARARDEGQEMRQHAGLDAAYRRTSESRRARLAPVSSGGAGMYNAASSTSRPSIRVRTSVRARAGRPRRELLAGLPLNVPGT